MEGGRRKEVREGEKGKTGRKGSDCDFFCDFFCITFHSYMVVELLFIATTITTTINTTTTSPLQHTPSLFTTTTHHHHHNHTTTPYHHHTIIITTLPSPSPHTITAISQSWCHAVCQIMGSCPARPWTHKVDGSLVCATLPHSR